MGGLRDRVNKGSDESLNSCDTFVHFTMSYFAQSSNFLAPFGAVCNQDVPQLVNFSCDLGLVAALIGQHPMGRVVLVSDGVQSDLGFLLERS